MKILAYAQEGAEKIGVLSQEGKSVLELSGYGDMNALIESGDRIKAGTGAPVPLESVRLLPPIMHPRQDIICLGMNFADHAAEARRFKGEAFKSSEEYAVYFSKRVNEAVPGGSVIKYPEVTTQLDYEAELGVIIGKRAKDVSYEDALDYVFGYTIVNDMTARDVQTRHKQYYFGKSLDGCTPMGPWIVTADELTEPHSLQIRSWVNDELRQDGNTSQLIFNINHVISELSRGITLNPGTIISMGTPAGVGMGFVPPKYLNPGDTIICEVEGIGRLVSTIG